jgi:polyisoprenoid-binding protein YceI
MLTERHTASKIGCMRIFAILFIFLGGLCHTAWAMPIGYNLVKERSHIGFTYQFGETEIMGRFVEYNSDISIDFERPDNSHVSVVLNTGTARAGFVFATQALRSKNVLDATKYTDIEFVSNSISADGKNIAIKGMITVRGITKPLTLNAQLLRAPGTKLGERENLQMRITGEINRHDFGASGFPNDVGDMLGINIDMQIKRQ